MRPRSQGPAPAGVGPGVRGYASAVSASPHVAAPPSAGRAIRLEPGPWEPAAQLASGQAAIGFLVVEGLVARDVVLGAGVAADLLGPGDLAVAGDDAGFLPIRVDWFVCTPAQVTYLDEALLASLRERPDLAARLLFRASQQASRQAVHRTISQLPRVELRLLALLWHLAERWGRVGQHGVVVPIALTHAALGRMVGARRPTVSLALKQLDEEGAVHRRGDGAWVLASASLTRLDAVAAPPSPAPAPEAILAGPAPLADGPLAEPEQAPPGAEATNRAATMWSESELIARVEELTAEYLRGLRHVDAAVTRSVTRRDSGKLAREGRSRSHD